MIFPKICWLFTNHFIFSELFYYLNIRIMLIKNNVCILNETLPDQQPACQPSLAGRRRPNSSWPSCRSTCDDLAGDSNTEKKQVIF